MALAVVSSAIVAGVSDGDGALEVVCVRDRVERDLSRKSTTDCHEHHR